VINLFRELGFDENSEEVVNARAAAKAEAENGSGDVLTRATDENISPLRGNQCSYWRHEG
jgi:hypothetical protein